MSILYILFTYNLTAMSSCSVEVIMVNKAFILHVRDLHTKQIDASNKACKYVSKINI